jgi:hypothetical protein
MLYLLGYGEPPVPEFAGRTKAGGEGNSEPERYGGGRDERRHNTTHRSSCTRTTPSSTPFTTPPWPPPPPRCASGPLRVWLPPLARRMLRAARCEQGTRRSGRLRDLHGTTDADGGAAAAANHGSAQNPQKCSPAVANNIIVPETPDGTTDADGGAAAAANHGSAQNPQKCSPVAAGITAVVAHHVRQGRA